MNLLSQFKIYIYRNRRYNSHEQSLKRLVINKGHNKTEFYNNNWRKVYYDVDNLFKSYIEEKCTVMNSLPLEKNINIDNVSILETLDKEYIIIIIIYKLIYNFILE